MDLTKFFEYMQESGKTKEIDRFVIDQLILSNQEVFGIEAMTKMNDIRMLEYLKAYHQWLIDAGLLEK